MCMRAWTLTFCSMLAFTILITTLFKVSTKSQSSSGPILGEVWCANIHMSAVFSVCVYWYVWSCKLYVHTFI
jgi:hypothetical protein